MRDNMLDGLSESLNEAADAAVKSTVGTAVTEAVQTVRTEVLTNPEIHTRFQQSSAGPAKKTFDDEAFTDARLAATERLERLQSRIVNTPAALPSSLAISSALLVFVLLLQPSIRRRLVTLWHLRISPAADMTPKRMKCT